MSINDQIRRARDADLRSWNLQWLALGILLGCKELRKDVDPADFSEQELACACSELRGNGDGAFHYLSKVLDSCGVIWKAEDGPPVDAILKELAQDGEVHRALVSLTRLLDAQPRLSPEHKRQFIEGLRGLMGEVEK